MKKVRNFKRIVSVMLCLVMMLCAASLSASAAKEMFTTYQIDDVTITGIEAPAAGKPFDFTAQESSQKYNIIKVAWRAQYKDNYITSTSSSASAGTKYTVYVVLEVATADHFFKTDSYRNSAVSSVTVNGNTATANNAQNYELFSVDASKYEHDTTYQKYLVVSYTFPTVEAAPIHSVEFSVGALVAGERVPTTMQASAISINSVNGSANSGQIGVSKIEWSLQSGGALAGNSVFEYGKKYALKLTLTTNYGTVFATDPNHILAQPGKPFPAVTVTMNGKTATVLPTYDNYSNMYVVASCIFDCDTAAKISKIELGGIDAPETGKTPDYDATYLNAGYAAASYNNATTKNGISWYNETDRRIMSTTEKFEAAKTYTAQITVWANEGYEFRYVSGAISVTGTVNGNSAEVSSRSQEEATLYYTFAATAEHQHSAKKVEEYKASCKEEGKRAYYFCSECGKNFEDSKCTKQITDINAWGKIEKLEHTGGRASCTERAVCKNCGEAYGSLAPHNFRTDWESIGEAGHAHKCKECGALGETVAHSGTTAKCGEISKCAECRAEYGGIVQHRWSTTADYTDSKGHAYKCTLCGEHGTVQPHSGGTADCKNKAVCSVCGTAYGKTADHKYSSEWLYKTASGHAHGCTVEGCDSHDSVVKHTPGAEATEQTAQLCTVCGYKIKPELSHKHNLTKTEEVAATCTTNGKKAYYSCDSCDSIFSDSKGKNEIVDDSEIIIEAAGHKESKWKTDEDTHWKECTAKGCDEIVVEREAHTFNKSGKCTVCQYRQGGGVDSEQSSDTEAESDTSAIDESAVDTGSGENTGDTADTSGNTAIWIVVIVCIVVAIGGVAAFVLLRAKKIKKNQ